MRTKRFAFGRWLDDSKNLTLDDVRDLCAKAQEAQTSMNAYEIDKILSLLAKVRLLWINPESRYRVEAEKALSQLTGFSHEMIQLGLKEMGALLDPNILQKKIDTELKGIPRGLGFHYRQETQTFLKWHAIGTVFHVLSGNVFLVGPSSLVEGLLTGNVNILKMSSEETFFLPLFLESLIECDEEGIITKSIAAIAFSSKEKDIIEEFKKSVDGIIVWGGEVAVQTYRAGLPSKTRLIIFGPKLSFSYLAAPSFKNESINEIAFLLAQEISIWDQNACTAPQVCFVQGQENAELLLEAMPLAMKKVSTEFPNGKADPNAAVDIRQLRSLFSIAESRGEKATRYSENGVDWTILLDSEVTLEASPLNRTIRLVPVSGMDDVLQGIAPFKNYLQTVGILAPAEEYLEISESLAKAGALKITILGEMSGGDVDDPHDGAYDLPQLLNLVVTKWNAPKKDLTPLDLVSEGERTRIFETRLRSMVNSARHAKFYDEKLGSLKIETFKDLQKVTPLTREEWESNMVPKTLSLMTRDASGGYVTRSGGSTGHPKFSFFDEKDWAAMCENAINAFRACGLEKGDRLGNFMLAGDLYGSFISFNHVNFLMGITSFAFAGEYTPEGFLDVWRSFKLNAIQGLPSVFMVLLRKCKAIEPKLQLEKVVYAGLPMSEEDRQWLSRELGVKRIASIIGTTEAGQLAYQCEKLSGTFHHIADDYNHIELLDENNNLVEAGVRGRIAVTTLQKTNFPLIRYLIGDAGQWVKEPCACGRKSKVFQYLGRWDDILSIGNSNLRYSEIVKALDGLPLSEVQVVGAFKNRAESLNVRVEAPNVTAGLDKEIRDRLFKAFPSLEFEDKEGTMPLTVEVLAPGSLLRNQRSGKVMAIVDERAQAVSLKK